MVDLESRLAGIDTEQTRSNLVTQLSQREYRRAASRSNPYLKYDLVEAIERLINAYAPTEDGFDNKLNAINKEELKKVYYGLKALDNREQNKQGLKRVMTHLTDWEKIIFFAGAFTHRDTTAYTAGSLSDLVKTYIKSGYDELHAQHMIKKAKGNYTRPLKLPGSQNYRKDAVSRPGQINQPQISVREEFEMRNPSVLESAYRSVKRGEEDAAIIGDDDVMDEAHVKTTRFFDSLTELERRYLTEKFGQSFVNDSYDR